jgi:tetratricopeptide (TPR) repeat protein
MTKAKNVEEYIAQQRAAISANPDCGISHYNLAVGLLGQKKYDEAEIELREAIGCSPTLAEAYVQLGGLCLQRGDLDGCLAYNQRAVKARAGFSEGYGTTSGQLKHEQDFPKDTGTLDSFSFRREILTKQSERRRLTSTPILFRHILHWQTPI